MVKEESFWDVARTLASSRVLLSVAIAAIGAALLLDAPRTAPQFSETLGYVLVLHIWVALSNVVKRSTERGSVTGRKILFLFLSLLLSYTFMYTSMNAASGGKDFKGGDAEWNASGEDAKEGKQASSYKTLRAMGDFAYFSMVSMSTVGYGDVAPQSHRAKFAVCTHLLSTFVLAGVLVNRLETSA